ncbi:MAG TPA: sulfite exporter TauE/SafE family protein [Clostridiales bacterium]|nr:sulfite exporter TauE/SafE family protein [Clostridiales bacterium]
MLFTLIGIIAGIIGGMGIGGGSILIPALIFFGHISQKTAQSVNLITFLPIAAVSLIIHTRRGRVRYTAAIFLIVFALIGAIIGSRLAIIIEAYWLRKLFGLFLLIMGIYEFFRMEN